jgi:hypothetical protein
LARVTISFWVPARKHNVVNVRVTLGSFHGAIFSCTGLHLPLGVRTFFLGFVEPIQLVFLDAADRKSD